MISPAARPAGRPLVTATGGILCGRCPASAVDRPGVGDSRLTGRTHRRRRPPTSKSAPGGLARATALETGMPDRYVTIGGVTVTERAAREALMALREAPGVMIRQPLSRAGSQLAGMDY